MNDLTCFTLSADFLYPMYSCDIVFIIEDFFIFDFKVSQIVEISIKGQFD